MREGIAMTAFTARGDELASKLAASLGGSIRGKDQSLADWTRESFASCDALIFVGAADAWAEETAGGETVYDRFGARCVRKGRRALLTADEGAIASRRDKRAFLAWLRSDCPELGASEIAAVEAERKVALFDSLRAAVNPIGMVMEQQIAPPPGSADLSPAAMLQYKALALIFARDLAPDFF